MKLDKGLVAGSSTLLILSLLEHGDLYGYQMIEELARRSNDVFQMRELLADKKTEWTRFHQGVEDVLSGGANALSCI